MEIVFCLFNIIHVLSAVGSWRGPRVAGYLQVTHWYKGGVGWGPVPLSSEVLQQSCIHFFM